MSVAVELDVCTPKCHLTYHMITRSLYQGNPLRYQVFVDESLNRLLRDTLRHVHQSNFENLGMLKIAEALRRPAVRQRVR